MTEGWKWKIMTPVSVNVQSGKDTVKMERVSNWRSISSRSEKGEKI